MTDEVNHPAHYNDGAIETWDYIVDKLTTQELRGYVKGNILKYISREKNKDGDRDMRKAQWYLNKFLEIIKPKENCKQNAGHLERKIRERLYEDTMTPEKEEGFTSADLEYLRSAGLFR